MSRGVALVLLVLAGCIDSSLVPCGTAVCPAADRCIAGVCASADQLKACSGQADGDSCTLITGTVGRCRTGVCIPVGCGNNVIDPGEVCDDGNVAALDGCSGTCDSDESCGNGVLDVVKGESCDCGTDAATQPATCATTNSADPTTACTPDCQLRACGDNTVGGAEQCDGTAPLTQACTAFGYYGGELACSSLCQFDVSACTGRCGDAVVDPVESCDGTPPVNASCLDYGFDLGPLGCSSVCTPGLVDCDRFGWSRADATVAQATQVWAGSGRFALLFSDGSVVVNDAGARSTQPGPFSAITGTPTAIYAFGANKAMQYSAGAWTTLSVTGLWGATAPTSAWASSTLGVFVAAPGMTAYHYTVATSLWSEHTVPDMTAPRFGGSLTKAYLFEPGAADVRVWRSTADDFIDPGFQYPTALTILDIADSATALYVATGDDLYTGTLAGNVWITTGTKASRVTSTSKGGVDVLIDSTRLQRLVNGAFGPIAAPPGTIAIAEDAGRAFAVGAPAGAFVLDRGVWSDVPAPPTAAYYTHIRAWRTGGFALSGAYAAHILGLAGTWTSLTVIGGTRDTLHGEQTDSFTQVSVFDHGFQFVPTSGPSLIGDLMTVDPITLWRTGSIAFAAGTDGVVRIDLVGKTFAESSIPNAQLVALDGTSATNVYAAGQMGSSGVIYHHDGTTWSAVDTSPETNLPPLKGIFASPDGDIFAAGGDTIVHFTAATQTWSHWQVPGATFTGVDGTSNTDVWFVGVAAFGFAFSGLHHWDGQNLYPVRLPIAGTAHAIFTDPGRLGVLVVDDSTNIDSVISLARVTTW